MGQSISYPIGKGDGPGESCADGQVEALANESGGQNLTQVDQKGVLVAGLGIELRE